MDVDALKQKAINLYIEYIHNLQKGYRTDYQDIINLINFINLPINIDNNNVIKQYLLNK